jgi:hypothetical protein
MCRTCHKAFDSHKLGIHPTDKRWIVIDGIRKSTASSSKAYSSYHGKPVVFASDSAPPLPLLGHMMSRFTLKNKNDNPLMTAHYCHFCPNLFKGEDGIDKLKSHLQVCKKAKQPKKTLKVKRTGTAGKRKTGDTSVAATATSRGRKGVGAKGGSRNALSVKGKRKAVSRGQTIPYPPSGSTHVAAIIVNGGVSEGASTQKRKSKEEKAEHLPKKKRFSTANK